MSAHGVRTAKVSLLRMEMSPATGIIEEFRQQQNLYGRFAGSEHGVQTTDWSCKHIMQLFSGCYRPPARASKAGDVVGDE
jgi:hypothetical protein